MRAAVAAGVLALACAGSNAPSAAPVPPSTEQPPALSRPLPAAAPPLLEVELAVEPTRTRVVVRARGEPEKLAIWTLSRGRELRELELADDAGKLELERADITQGGTRITLGRPVKGAVVARYSVPSDDPSRLAADGHALLLLPTGYDDTTIGVVVRIDPSKLGQRARGASTLGLEQTVALSATADALRRTTFVAGELGQARFDAPEGKDDAVWSGILAFDARQVAAEVAGFRTGAREYFAARSALPLTLAIIGDARPVGAFAVARRAGGVSVRVGPGQPWNGPLRLAVAQQVQREWIGGELTILPQDANHPFDTAWLTDGVNRMVARELLFRFGLITPEEYRDEIENLLALHLTSPATKVPLHALSKHPDRDRAETAAVVRGALYASLLDARLRKASGGKRSLDDVLRALFTRARSAPGPLPKHAWREAVASELGEAPALEIEARHLYGDETIVLPAGALGPCFAERQREYPLFSLGFRVGGDESSGTLATDVDPRGAAARAGLREREPIRGLAYSTGRTDVKVRLQVQRDGKWTELSYLPVGGSVRGQGFVRVPKIRDEDCANRRAQPPTR